MHPEAPQPIARPKKQYASKGNEWFTSESERKMVLEYLREIPLRRFGVTPEMIKRNCRVNGLDTWNARRAEAMRLARRNRVRVTAKLSPSSTARLSDNPDLLWLAHQVATLFEIPLEPLLSKSKAELYADPRAALFTLCNTEMCYSRREAADYFQREGSTISKAVIKMQALCEQFDTYAKKVAQLRQLIKDRKPSAAATPNS